MGDGNVKTIVNKPFHGNMRHVFDGAKIVYFEHSLLSASTRRSNFTRTRNAGSQTATSVRNKQFCPVKNMAHNYYRERVY